MSVSCSASLLPNYICLYFQWCLLRALIYTHYKRFGNKRYMLGLFMLCGPLHIIKGSSGDKVRGFMGCGGAVVWRLARWT